MCFVEWEKCFAFWTLTVPERMNLPEDPVTGRAVLAVRGVLIACSIVPGRPDCVLGLTNPVTGRPDCVTGLITGRGKINKHLPCHLKNLGKLSTKYLTAGEGPPP